jgi:hypothetical protein
MSARAAPDRGERRDLKRLAIEDELTLGIPVDYADRY